MRRERNSGAEETWLVTPEVVVGPSNLAEESSLSYKLGFLLARPRGWGGEVDPKATGIPPPMDLP